ncbi:MAG: uroporphyrinogen-III C-methyltransferase [Acidiferrobacterales bacterium]
MTENDQQQAPQTEEPSVETADDQVEKPVTKVRTGRAWAAIAFLFSIAALAASGYLGYMYYQKQDLFAADVLGTLTQLETNTEQIQQGRSTIEKNLQGFEQKLNDLKQIQDTLGTAIERMANDLGRNRNDWVLSETEQLLVIANHRLQLAHDIDTAVTALRAADRRLQQLADPGLLSVRKLIAAEVAELQSLERADVPGIALRLGSLAKTLDRLPLDVERSFRPPAVPVPAEPQTSAEKSRVWNALSKMWRDLMGQIRIRKATDLQKPLLAPDQSYFLHENLRLMLYGAQLAVLQADVATYGQNLKSAQTWINDYFETDSQAVVRFQEELKGLAGEKIVVELPDISASLDALRAATSKQAGSQMQADL